MPQTLHIPTILELTNRSVDWLFDNIKKMPEDKLAYSPTPETRSTRDFLHEISEAYNMFAEVLETNNSTKLSWEYWQPKLKERAPAEQSLTDLESRVRAAHERFATAITSLPEDRLDQKIPGSDWQPSPRDLAYFPLRNNWYHGGQINYIQCCYGDFD
ncbi:MAG: DinB family protein [Fimbriimonadaceae bacterium]